MRSFVTKIKNLLILNTEDEASNFNQEKRILRIPLYQREYKWDNDKIISLINDINKRDKFLGNIILNETDLSYEIVDGQQRVTTCILILVYLYNYYSDSHMEQQSILNVLKLNDHFILENDTVGNFLQEDENRISLKISQDSDVYYQSDDFNRAYNVIQDTLSYINCAESARNLKEKLLNSEVLVLINDQYPMRSIEQIFLDINEKAKLLDIEDIFKGHCFEIFDSDFHDYLRESWIKLKKCAAGFRIFNVKNLGEFIYSFLLVHDRNSLQKNLSEDGRHYLDGKTMDQVNDLLQEMIVFGEGTLSFLEDLHNSRYYFSDVCENSYEYRNTNDLDTLKEMSLILLEIEKSYYQKLPFMYFIFYMKNNNELVKELDHPTMKKIFSNLFIYSYLFSLKKERKSKKLVDQTIKNALKEDENKFSFIVNASKELRKNQVEDYRFNTSAKYDELSIIYSIMDNYVANDNWIEEIYSRNNGFNLEHFLIPNKRPAKIKWNHSGRAFEIELDSEFAKQYRDLSFNYLILNGELNESMGRMDIVSKIHMIKEWYSNRNMDVPVHIDLFIRHIESLEKYNELLTCMEEDEQDFEISTSYESFLSEYFSEDSQNSLLEKLNTQFKISFQN